MKTIWGLFGSYGDARAALDELQRRGFAPEDVSAALLSNAMRPAPGGRQGGAKGGRRRGRADRPAPVPGGGPPATGTGPAGPDPALPGGQELRLPGLPPLLASGALASALGRAAAGRPARARPESTQPGPQGTPGPAAAGAPAGKNPADKSQDTKSALGSVLMGLGLPPSYAQNYAEGVRRGQILLAIRIPDQRERDTVNLMRRYRVMALAGQPE